MAYDWMALIRERGCRHVLDVGANVGAMTLRFLDAGAEQVIAVEPIPECFTVLKNTFAGEPRVRVLPLGISDVEGLQENLAVYNCWTIVPEQSKPALDRSPGFIDKPPFSALFTTIDQLLAAHSFEPDFIKIDVDGYEAKAMRGARGYLARRRPTVLLEISYLPRLLFNDCCECMIHDAFSLGYKMTSAATGQVFADTQDFMRCFPWNTSFDVVLEPQ